MLVVSEWSIPLTFWRLMPWVSWGIATFLLAIGKSGRLLKHIPQLSEKRVKKRFQQSELHISWGQFSGWHAQIEKHNTFLNWLFHNATWLRVWGYEVVFMFIKVGRRNWVRQHCPATYKHELSAMISTRALTVPPCPAISKAWRLDNDFNQSLERLDQWDRVEGFKRGLFG